MPLHRRMPKRGFHNPFSISYSVVNLEELNVFPAGETVTPELLRAHGFIRRAQDRIKVLGDGELTAKIAIHAHAFSASAKEKIAAAGGTVTWLRGEPVEKKPKRSKTKSRVASDEVDSDVEIAEEAPPAEADEAPAE